MKCSWGRTAGNGREEEMNMFIDFSPSYYLPPKDGKAAVELAERLLRRMEGVEVMFGTAGTTAPIAWPKADPPSLIQERNTTALQPEGTFFLGYLCIYIVLWDTTLNVDQILFWVPLLLDLVFCWALVAGSICRDQPCSNYRKGIFRRETKHF